MPLIIIVTDICGYLYEQAADYKKRRNRKQIDDLEQETVSLNRSLARWTFALAVFSILTFFVSLGTLLILKAQLREMHTGGEDTHTLADAAKSQSGYAQASAKTAQTSYIAESRAFIGPSDASITPFQVGQPVKAIVQYRNTGREPAGLNFIAKITSYDSESQWGSISIIDIFNNRAACMISNADPTSFAFPNNGFSQYQISVSGSDTPINEVYIDQPLIEGKKVAAIMGCANYYTIGTMHHTAFCFFYQNGKVDASHLQFCAKGWDAD